MAWRISHIFRNPDHWVTNFVCNKFSRQVDFGLCGLNLVEEARVLLTDKLWNKILFLFKFWVVICAWIEMAEEADPWGFDEGDIQETAPVEAAAAAPAADAAAAPAAADARPEMDVPQDDGHYRKPVTLYKHWVR